MFDISKSQEFIISISGPGTDVKLTVFGTEDMAIIDSVISRVRKQIGLMPVDKAPIEKAPVTKKKEEITWKPTFNGPVQDDNAESVTPVVLEDNGPASEESPAANIEETGTVGPVAGAESVSSPGKIHKAVQYSKIPSHQVPWRWRITPETGKGVRDCIVSKNEQGKYQILTMKGNEVTRTTDLKDDSTSAALQIRQMISNAKYAKHVVDIWEIKEVEILNVA